MERSIGRIIATALGAGFLLAGVIGFINHDLLGMHLSTSLNLVHIISGILAIYIGLTFRPVSRSYIARSSRCTQTFSQ